MDYKNIEKKLGLEEGYINRHKDHGIEELSYKGLSYLCFRKKLRDVEKGTVAFSERDIIVGYPKIRRMLLLGPSLKKHFTRFHLEEKLDGYNIRVAKVEEKILAFTRGGLVCPFSTDFVQEKVKRFFEENDLVLCGELVGKGNPYMVHDYPEIPKLDLFIFDIREKVTGKPVPFSTKTELCEKYGLKTVPYIGEFSSDEMEKIYKIVRKMDKKRREGFVAKTEDMSQQAKYIFPAANTRELEFGFKFPFDYGRDFIFRRLVREGFQSFELKESRQERNERAARIGRAILNSMVESIETISRGEELTNDAVIEGKKEILEEFVGHLKDLGIHFDYKLEKGKLTIKRKSPRNSDKIKFYLEGGFCEE